MKGYKEEHKDEELLVILKYTDEQSKEFLNTPTMFILQQMKRGTIK